MPTLALADVQSMITSLIVQYKAMAATSVHEYTMAQRSAHKHKLAELREELMAWGTIESEMTTGAGGMNVLVAFGDQV